jgi:hypothetical protein
MADPLHNSLSAFRDTILTAVARLEFQMRDMRFACATAPCCTGPSTSNYVNYNSTWTPPGAEFVSPADISAVRPDPCGELVNALNELGRRVETLELRLSSAILQQSVAQPPVAQQDVDQILEIEPPTNSRNVLVPSVRNTPALAAAVAAASPPEMILVSDDEEEEEDDENVVDTIEESEDEAVVEEEEEEDDENPLKPVTINGKPYFTDADNAVYVETDEGYEEIGTYNPSTKSLTLHDAGEEEEEEAEEEAIEVEDFVYKGKTYQRDSENNVYYDGEAVGTWNGKRIVT